MLPLVLVGDEQRLGAGEHLVETDRVSVRRCKNGPGAFPSCSDGRQCPKLLCPAVKSDEGCAFVVLVLSRLCRRRLADKHGVFAAGLHSDTTVCPVNSRPE